MVRRRSLVFPAVAAAAFLLAAAAPEPADAAKRWRMPRAGALVASPPLLRWRPVRHALFYNVQLYRGDRKVLTRWPRKPRFRVGKTWANGARTHRLRHTTYRWYVWPAYRYPSGYGRLRIRSSFTFGLRPRLVREPGVVGETREGHVLTADGGSWRAHPRPRLSYAWRRCAADGECEPIPQARSRRYTARAEDIDLDLVVVVTASNGLGAKEAVSTRVGPVLPAPPTNLTPPRIAGGAQVGAVARAVDGAWESSRPLGYAFQWLRCDATCQTIEGATEREYEIRPRDLLLRLRVAVTATNGGGSASATSSASSAIGRTLAGTRAPDRLDGSAGSDIIRTFAGNDVVRALAGPDRAFGGRGDDRLHGGTGDDRLAGASGHDVLVAGPGDDLVVARDGARDVVTCGRGNDEVLADPRDRVSVECEEVLRAP